MIYYNPALRKGQAPVASALLTEQEQEKRRRPETLDLRALFWS